MNHGDPEKALTSDSSDEQSLPDQASEELFLVEQASKRVLTAERDSAYDDLLFGPLVRRSIRLQNKEDGSWVQDYSTYCILLFLTITLQFALCMKITDLSWRERAELRATLLDDACWKINSSPLGGVLLPESFPDAEMWDCTPSLVTLLQSPELLDVDHDGVWTLSEANLTSERILGLEAGRNSERLLNFEELQESINLYLSKQGTAPVGTSGVNMDFFKKYAGLLKICVPVNGDICADLEKDGLLKSILPDFHSRAVRIRECKLIATVTFCPVIFGERYDWLRKARSDVCGERDFDFDTELGSAITTYDMVQRYLTNADAMVTWRYKVFFALIIFIWFALLLDGSVQLIRFGFHVLSIQTLQNDSDKEFLRATIEEHEKIRIFAIPQSHKVLVLVFAVLPRAATLVYLGVAGTIFLTFTDDSRDLIVDAVALGFLADIDKLIHHAFLPNQFRDEVQSCEMSTELSGVEKMFITRSAWTTFSAVGLVLGTFLSLFAYPRVQILAEAYGCLCKQYGECLGHTLTHGWAS